MNLLPNISWQHIVHMFKSKYELAVFLAEITVSTNFMRDIKQNKPEITKSRRRKSENIETEPNIYYGRGIFHNKFQGIEIYSKCSEQLGINLIDNPDLAMNKDYLILIAAWLWVKYYNISSYGSNFNEINKFLDMNYVNISSCEQYYSLYINYLETK